MFGPIERTRYELRVDASPDDVIVALVDFGPERGRIWRETSHPAVFRVHRIGDREAEVTEGVPFAWSRERYDWSTPGVVTLTQLDSNVARNGVIRYDIQAAGSGSLIRCERYREFHGIRGRIVGTLDDLGRPVDPAAPAGSRDRALVHSASHLTRAVRAWSGA